MDYVIYVISNFFLIFSRKSSYIPENFSISFLFLFFIFICNWEFENNILKNGYNIFEKMIYNSYKNVYI